MERTPKWGGQATGERAKAVRGAGIQPGFLHPVRWTDSGITEL